MPRSIAEIETELGEVRSLSNRYNVDRVRLVRELFAAKMLYCFNEHPELVTVSWTQYTPYFNDGSECYFSVNEQYVNGLDSYGEESSEYTEDMPTVSDGCRASVSEVLGDFERDEYKEIFGDHVKVLVTRDGVSVQAYDHD